MVSIEKVNINSKNSTSFTSLEENKNEQQKSTIKKYLTAPNVILGSLATIGILGMADILICKGKHINKLTGTDKQIKYLNEGIEGLEKHQEAKNKEISRLYEEIKTYSDETRQAREEANSLRDELKKYKQ